MLNDSIQEFIQMREGALAWLSARKVEAFKRGYDDFHRLSPYRNSYRYFSKPFCDLLGDEYHDGWLKAEAEDLFLEPEITTKKLSQKEKKDQLRAFIAER